MAGERLKVVLMIYSSSIRLITGSNLQEKTALHTVASCVTIDEMKINYLFVLLMIIALCGCKSKITSQKQADSSHNAVLVADQQSSSDLYLLRWKIKDSVSYKVAFDQIEMIDENQEDADTSSIKHTLNKILNKISEEFKDYGFESSIKRKKDNYNVSFYMHGIPILNGDINPAGDLLTHLEGTSVNFFKIFYDLPNHEIKVGDSWASNIQIQKKIKGITLTDSVKTDKVLFKEIIKENNNEYAVLKYEIYEFFEGNYIDENNVEKQTDIELLFDIEGRFNVSEGRWKQLDGIMMFEFNLPQPKKSVMKIGLIKKE